MAEDLRSVYVGNVEYSSTTKQLEEFFTQCGTVVRVTIPQNRETQKPKGFAYVEFSDPMAAQSALQLSGAMFNGRNLKVNPKRSTVPGFGGDQPGSPGKGYKGGKGGKGGGKGKGQNMYDDQGASSYGGGYQGGYKGGYGGMPQQGYMPPGGFNMPPQQYPGGYMYAPPGPAEFDQDEAPPDMQMSAEEMEWLNAQMAGVQLQNAPPVNSAPNEEVELDDEAEFQMFLAQQGRQSSAPPGMEMTEDEAKWLAQQMGDSTPQPSPDRR